MTDGRGGQDELTRLALKARDGDEEAFRLLVLRTYPKILRWTLVRTGDPDDAEDVTQEVLVSLHRRLEDFRGRGSIESWLYRVTANHASDLAARRNRHRRLKERVAAARVGGGEKVGTGTPVDLGGGRITELIRSFLRELPPRQREAFDLVDLQGLTPGEAAGRMELEGSTVRVHLLRARRRVRQWLVERQPGIPRETR